MQGWPPLLIAPQPDGWLLYRNNDVEAAIRFVVVDSGGWERAVPVEMTITPVNPSDRLMNTYRSVALGQIETWLNCARDVWGEMGLQGPT